eukprot:GCRY01000905.1.p1 GENE.GCRY01000905.1~~GCRY01000905.1.p1  ORF type:complete len:172 (-),score=22.46 GCRY01000905.1:124-639(-)
MNAVPRNVLRAVFGLFALLFCFESFLGSSIILHTESVLAFISFAAVVFHFFFLCYNSKFSFPNVVGFVVTLVLGSIFFHLLAILFGAPFFENWELTLLFGLLMSSFVCLPLFVTVGLNVSEWIDITVGAQYDSDETLELFIQNIFVCGGAWFGAVPIPLDGGFFSSCSAIP